MKKYRFIAEILSILFLFIFTFAVIGNPIPVFPDPDVISIGFENIESVNLIWMIFVFLVDFCINIFIVYGGIFLLYYFGQIKHEDVFDFSKIIFLISILIISIVGIGSELIFGTWLIGLVFALITIFISYIMVMKYLLKFSWLNCFLMGFFALIINIFFWLVIFAF